MLLEEHPLQGFGPFDRIFGRKVGAARDIPEDGIRFREIASGRDFEQRHLAGRILVEEFGRAGFTLENIDLGQAIRRTHLGQGQTDL